MPHTYILTKKQGRKLIALAAITYPDGAVCSVARAQRELASHGHAFGRVYSLGTIQGQKNFAGVGDAPQFAGAAE